MPRYLAALIGKRKRPESHGCGGLWVAFSLEINPVEEWIGSGLQNSTSCWFQPPALETYSLKLIFFPTVRGEKRKYLKPAPSQWFFFSVSLLTSTRFLCFVPVASLEQYGSVFKLKQVVSEFGQTKIYCDHPNHGTVVKRERDDYVEKSSVAKRNTLQSSPAKSILVQCCKAVCSCFKILETNSSSPYWWQTNLKSILCS